MSLVLVFRYEAKVKEGKKSSEIIGMGEPKLDLVKQAEKASQEDAVSAITSKMRQAVGQGASDLVRNVILGHVVEQRYDTAIRELTEYLDSKPQYPDFKERSEKYVQYAIELIHAIQAKRSFPGWNALNMSKQKELFEKALMHFEDLKATLGKVEIIEREVRVEDVKSTVWVMQACVYSICALLLFAIIREISGGVLPTASTLLEITTGQAVDFIFEKFKL